MSFVVAILAIVVALLVFLVAGLLRSHAEILRRLHALDPDGAPDRATSPGSTTAAADARRDLDLPEPVTQTEGRAAADLAGTTPSGDAVGVRVTGTAHDTVLVFLSSGCTTCHGFWEAMRTAELPGGARLVVVTKGEEHESPVAVGELAPENITVVMTSEAWSDYNVPGSPYLVHVDGASGTVRGEGTGADWEAVRRMLLDAAGDLDRRAGDLDQRRSRKAAADAAREREVDDVLLSAGIQPGDPSLYPETET